MDLRAIPGWAALALALSFTSAASAQDQSETRLPSRWMADAHGCKVWDPQPEPNETVTWSGACVDGYASGRGVTVWIENGVPDEQADGTRVAGHMQGHAVQTSPNGDKYVGEWKDDRKEGHGELTTANGARYLGDFKDDLFDGMGTLTDGAGSSYTGHWKAGQKSGRGKAKFADGTEYDGLWVNDKPLGRGDPA